MANIRSALEMKSTVELDACLRAELLKESADGDLVRRIIRILEDREKDYPVEVTPQIQAAWDKYQGRAERPRPMARSWVIRAASMAAILCVILLAVIPQPAKAESWWERFARWTDSVFEFVMDGEADDERPEYVFQTDNPGLQEVYDAVTELGVTVPVVPMWIPEGYELVSCEKQQAKKSVNMIAIFSDGEKELVYRAFILDADVGNKYQKNEGDVIEYEMCGISHNIMQNRDKQIAVWRNKNIECAILFDSNEDTLRRMIWSIYTTEDYV